MKLIFAYINQYRSINKINFNLGGKYRFHFDSETNVLSFEKNDFYIEDFFNVSENPEANFANVKIISAIVGENGVGKTTFLDFIKDNFIKGMNGFDTEAIVVLESYTEDKILIYIPAFWEIEPKSLKALGENAIFEVKLYGLRSVAPDLSLKKVFSISEPAIIPETRSVSYIYLSNIFDKKEETEFSGLYNISTNYLIKKDFESKYENKIPVNPMQYLDEHRKNELSRELAFINAFKANYNKYIKFNLPSRLLAILTPLPDIKDSENILEAAAQKFLLEYSKFLDSNKSNLKNYELFLNNYFLRAITNILIELYKYGSLGIISFSEKDLSLDKFKSKDKPIYFEILEYFLTETKRVENLQKKLKAIKNILALLENYVKEEDNLVDAHQRIYQFNLESKKLQDKFFEFYNIYRRTYDLEAYLNFAWRDMSTGQKAVLNIYSRLYSLSDNELYKVGANLLLDQDIILLIDEGELYLHPTWQKEILSQLLVILPIIFKRDKEANGRSSRNIQIILTTNSPLPLTDVPASNIVFLKRERLIDGKEVIIAQDSLNDQKHTFAANIHTLLSDSFFMQNGFIGEFAKAKINSIISELNSGKSLSPKRREEIRITIQMIGEPVLKNKLFQMYNDKFNMNIHERLDRIEKNLRLDDDKNKPS